MRPKHRHLLSYLLLATYAGISLLGDGLHELAPEVGHHHHGLYVVTASQEHGLYDHHIVSKNDAGPVLAASEFDVDAHLCEICAYIYQSLSQPAEVAASIDWQPLAVVAPSRPQPIYSPIQLGPQAPRGPPLLSA